MVEDARSVNVEWSGRRQRRPREPVSSTCTALRGCWISPRSQFKELTYITTFAELGTSEPVVEALRARSITEPFPVQELVISDALAGHDLLVQSPTGSGKTLAFGVPLVDLLEPGAGGPQALILAPTRELASQIVDELEASPRRAAAHRRRLRRSRLRPADRRGEEGRHPRRHARPARGSDRARRGLARRGSDVLVLDEADRMLDMGFRPAVDRIVALTPNDRQTLFFSATLNGRAGKAAARLHLRGALPHACPTPEEAAADVEHRFLRVESQGAKLDQLVAASRRRSPAARSSSSAPSAAPTGW